MRRVSFGPVTCRQLLSLVACAAAGFSLVPGAAAQRQALATRVAAPAGAAPIARLPAQQTLRMELSLPLRNEAQLQTFVQQLNDPSNPHYRQYLSVQQFTEQYGPTAGDYSAVIAFAQRNGLTVTRTFANRMVVNVSGPVANVNKAFGVTMKQYMRPAEQRTYYAPDVEPTVSTGVPLLTVNGLSTLNLPHPMLKQATKSQVLSSDTTGSGPDGQFLGSDMRAAYAPGVTLNGAGQTVGLIELGPYNLSDVQAYFSTIGQPLNVPIYNVLLDVDGVCSGTPATGGCDDGEEVIDMEQAISMAPNLSGLIIYEAYGSGSDALTAFTQAASDDIAKQISLSFGWGGTPSTESGYEQIFLELQAQGQNVFVASGDAGANVGGVGYPGNSPNITDAGGTDLTTSGAAGTWASETAWVGSGGGWNTASPIPSYQVPVINSLNQGSPSYRSIPDVAMEANTDNYFCANGACTEGIGGTSLAAPRWAGFLSLANEQADGNPVPFLNTTIYTLGHQSNYDNQFHDITVGNNFNSSSPDLFSAVIGYDLTTGWGTPTGQNLIDALAPVTSGAANFSLTASPTTVYLTPGSGGSSAVSIAPLNGFAGAVDLTAAVIGSPAGVIATLSQNTFAGSGSATLSIETTSATPGGNYLVAVTGISGAISHTAYVEIGLPFFALSISPTSLYLNQDGTATATITVTPQNGFSGRVSFAPLTGLPAGVTGRIRQNGGSSSATLTVAASADALTGVNTALSITANSGALTRTISSATLAVSAATGGRGVGLPVELSGSYNETGIYANGATYSTNGGLDGGGYSYSASLLTNAWTLSGVAFRLGPAGKPDAIYGKGQSIPLPAGHFTALQLLATGIEGEQAGQTVTVTYTDGTSSQFTQSFSDWGTSDDNPSEAEAVAMQYRNVANGTQDDAQFNLYNYTLILQSGKTVKSFTLPNNRDVVVLAATLTEQYLGDPVNLAPAFDANGIYTDGTQFASDGGLDGGGAAYSANLLGDAAGASDVVVDGIGFDIAPPNVSNAVYGTGAAIALPPGHFSSLRILGTGVQGGETSQVLTVTYVDGTKQQITQSFSDWFTPQDYPGELDAIKTAYRDYNDGTEDTAPFNLYEYTLPLYREKVVKSLTLPVSRNVLALAVTLVDDNRVP
jgi:hypothetical protein